MKANEKKLLHLYRGMQEDDQHAIMRYVEFLSNQQEELPTEIADVVVIPAEDDESVVGALKRLSASYPMLDKAKMLDQTSVLMSDHVLHGRDKIEVINELEALFEKQYKLIRENKIND